MYTWYAGETLIIVWMLKNWYKKTVIDRRRSAYWYVEVILEKSINLYLAPKWRDSTKCKYNVRLTTLQSRWVGILVTVQSNPVCRCPPTAASSRWTDRRERFPAPQQLQTGRRAAGHRPARGGRRGDKSGRLQRILGHHCQAIRGNSKCVLCT